MRVEGPPIPTDLMQRLRGNPANRRSIAPGDSTISASATASDAAEAFELALAFPVQAGGVTRGQLLLDLEAVHAR